MTRDEVEARITRLSDQIASVNDAMFVTRQRGLSDAALLGALNVRETAIRSERDQLRTLLSDGPDSRARDERARNSGEGEHVRGRQSLVAAS